MDAFVCRLMPPTCLAPTTSRRSSTEWQPKGLRLVEMLGNGTAGVGRAASEVGLLLFFWGSGAGGKREGSRRVESVRPLESNRTLPRSLGDCRRYRPCRSTIGFPEGQD
jgi:hypothetical protein